MTAKDIKRGFRDLALDERLELLGELWDEVSTEPGVFELSPDEQAELERRFASHGESPKSSRPWSDVLAELRGRG